jgi:hypothetical protein
LHLCLRDIGYRDIESMLATHSECQTIACHHLNMITTLL